MMRARDLRKGEYVILEGQPTNGYYVVQCGLISLHLLSAAGKLQIIRICGDGDSFGKATLAGDTCYPYNARALTKGTVFLVPRERLMELARKHPETTIQLLAALSHEMRRLVTLVRDVTLRTAEERFIHWLLANQPDSGESARYEIQLRYCKCVLASSLNLTSETLSRTLGKLQRTGNIRVQGKAIVVTDAEKLEQRLVVLSS